MIINCQVHTGAWELYFYIGIWPAGNQLSQGLCFKGLRCRKVASLQTESIWLHCACSPSLNKLDCSYLPVPTRQPVRLPYDQKWLPKLRVLHPQIWATNWLMQLDINCDQIQSIAGQPLFFFLQVYWRSLTCFYFSVTVYLSHCFHLVKDHQDKLHASDSWYIRYYIWHLCLIK